MLTPLRSASNEDQFMIAALEVEEGTQEAEGDERSPQETRWDWWDEVPDAPPEHCKKDKVG